MVSKIVDYSIVIPIYNEEKTIESLYFSLKEVMENLNKIYEIIFINDGSMNNSLEVLKNLKLRYNNMKLINLIKNSGQSQAMQAGFDIAKGEIIITLDGDGQFEPKDIPKLLNKLDESYDVVCGFRYKRRDFWLKIISSWIANLLRRILIGEKIHDVGCTFRAYRKDSLKDIKLKDQMHRFITAILLKNGCRITEVKVRHYPRKFGKSKYNIRNRLFSSLSGLLFLLKYNKSKHA